MKTITFFSYKGGAGRSTLCMNTLPILAKKFNSSKEHPIILFDLDIDSAGMTYLLGKEKEAYQREKYSVQDVFKDGYSQEESFNLTHSFFLGLCPVGDIFGLSKESILFLPAKDGAAIGNGSSYDVDAVGLKKLKDLTNLCEKAGCSALIFDSAVGDQITARWGNEVADIIVCVMRSTKQFREGTYRYFERFQTKISNKNIIIVPNAVPNERMVLGDKIYPDYAHLTIKDKFSDFVDNNHIYFDMLDDGILGIPMVKSFLWQESILDNKSALNLSDDEKFALTRYYKLVELIATIESLEGNGVDDF